MSPCAPTRVGILLLALLAALCGPEARAQELDPQRIAAVKAGMVVNFLRYTTWPGDAFKDEALKDDPAQKAPITITFIGDSDIESALLAAASGQEIGGRRVRVRRVRYPAPAPGERDPSRADLDAFHRDLRSSHAVYFATSERHRYRETLRELRTADVLTISDIDRFAENGGMLGLAIRDRKVAFDANEDAIKATRLRVSAQVLKLARIVGPGSERREGPR